MNIRKDEAGCVTGDYILKTGFKVDKIHECNNGWDSWTLTDYSKDDLLFLTGGYWTYYIKNKNGKQLWEGWWNSNDEFDETIKQLENDIQLYPR